MEERWSPKELAKRLRVTPQCLYSWKNQGKGPAYVKIGSALRYRASDVEAWIEENTEEPSSR